MFKIIAIQMKPKENICILQSTKISHSKSCIFFQHLFTNGDWSCQDWKIFVSDMLLYRVRHIVVHVPPCYYTVSAILLLEFVLNEKV